MKLKYIYLYICYIYELTTLKPIFINIYNYYLPVYLVYT